MNKSIRLLACGIVIGVSVSTPLYAEVFSDTVPSDLVEPADLYQLNDPDVVVMTAKIVAGTGGVCQAADKYANCSFTGDVLNDLDPEDDFKPEVKVLLTTDDLSPDGEVSNASLRLRGHSSRASPQKSFRIKLDSKKNLWRDERRIQLIKSVYDFARIRNALSYELLASIPALPSLRTQFVNLYIDDNGTSKDYGLFTHAEHIGKEFLVNRAWDKDSPVYKAEDFIFHTSSDFDLDSEGKPIDKDAFERQVEIKRGKNHSKFNEMLNALNDPNLDFNTQIMGKYFHLENYLSWLSFNILINNTDTVDQNYYLYNPKGKDVFYLMSWDNDYAWGSNLDDPKSSVEQQPRWWYSAANWWDVKLHRRFLEQSGNLAVLKSAVTEMRNKYLSSAKIKAITDKYYPVVTPLIMQSPDIDDLYVEGDTTEEKRVDYTKLFNRLKGNVDQNYQLFMQYADDPMTFYLDENIQLSNNKIKFGWEKSVSLLNQQISYDLDIATDPSFTASGMVQQIKNLTDNQYTLNWSHPKGSYYYRVIARDVQNPSIHWQVGENYFENIVHPATGEPIRGVVPFITQEDGEETGNTNTQPIARDMSISILKNRLSSLSLNTFDSDGDTLSVIITKAPSNGTLSHQSGTSLRYTPNTNYVGNDSFRYTVSDGKLPSDEATVAINIGGGSNSAPVAQNKTVSTLVGKSVTITALANDAEGDQLTYSISSQPRNGTVTINGNRLSYTPKASFTGTDSFKYIASDGKTSSGQATVTVKVGSTTATTTKKGGGFISWSYLLILASLVLVRRRYL